MRKEMIEALLERILKPFRIAASGIDHPVLVTSLEKPGLVYGSTIDSRRQFPVCESKLDGDRQAGADAPRW